MQTNTFKKVAQNTSDLSIRQPNYKGLSLKNMRQTTINTIATLLYGKIIILGVALIFNYSTLILHLPMVLFDFTLTGILLLYATGTVKSVRTWWRNELMKARIRRQELEEFRKTRRNMYNYKL